MADMLTQQEYLKAMGIEVWTTRTSMPTEAVEETLAAQPAREPVVARPPVVASATEAQEVPNFRLAFLHYEAVGLCLSLDQGVELSRRFCDDIARMMGGNLKAVRFQMLEWPMLNTAGIDQSLNAARQVVTQKFSILPPRVVVFGADVAHYFGPLKNIEAGNPGQVGKQSFLMIPSLSALMKSGAAKRDLMAILHRWKG